MIVGSCLCFKSLLMILCCLCVVLAKLGGKHEIAQQFNSAALEGKIITGSQGKAMFLIKNKMRYRFPDFVTFTSMGYNMSMVKKVPDHAIGNIPLGPIFPKISEFRPDDYMYHTMCEDADRMVNDLGLIANMGNQFRHLNVLRRVKSRKTIDILALGGSITAGGYFEGFKRLLEERMGLKVNVHNHGHGATEITYTLFCVDISRYSPDLVLIDFAVNDYGHPKLMEALIRKVLSIPSNPIVALVDLWVHRFCPTKRYLIQGWHYDIPVINICAAVNICYSRDRLPPEIYTKYSLTDGVHPWGKEGVPFIGRILYAWWSRYEAILKSEEGQEGPSEFLIDETSEEGKRALTLPERSIYASSPVGRCTRCDAIVGDADSKLEPIGTPKGFEIVVRAKIGFGGFNPADTNSSTKSFKMSYQANKPGSTITFPFYGSSVKIPIWQRRDEMGIIDAVVDGDTDRTVSASGFFKGYSWAMDRNNTGRSEIIPLFEGLPDKHHLLTLTVSDKPANSWVKGHIAQVFALLSASDNPGCKSLKFS